MTFPEPRDRALIACQISTLFGTAEGWADRTYEVRRQADGMWAIDLGYGVFEGRMTWNEERGHALVREPSPPWCRGHLPGGLPVRSWVRRYSCPDRHNSQLLEPGVRVPSHRSTGTCATFRWARRVLYLFPMRKPRRTRSRSSAHDPRVVDIVTQLETAIRRPQATLIGALVGGLVPWFARTLAHQEVPAAWHAGNHGLALAMVGVVLGCALFSALTVYKFGHAVFGDPRKAIGFTIALEGVMLVSHGTTSAVALAVLVAINALANGAAIAVARDATCKRREADARRAATRARRRVRATADRRIPTPPPARAPRRPPTPRLVRLPSWTNPRDVVDAEILAEEAYS